MHFWEELHNPDFNSVQFDAVRSEAGMVEELMHIVILLWHLQLGFHQN